MFPTFKVGGVEQSHNNVAVAFSNHFLNAIEGLNTHIAGDSDPVALLRKSHPSEIPTMQTVPISEGEIKSIINSLNSKISSGYDEITAKFLKLCRNQTSKPLAFIFNLLATDFFLILAHTVFKM